MEELDLKRNRGIEREDRKGEGETETDRRWGREKIRVRNLRRGLYTRKSKIMKNVCDFMDTHCFAF